jgi:hypothetical protein
MTEEHIIYNGASMIPEWPARIEAAQQMITYVINGREYPRVPYGDDGWDASKPCHDCAVIRGQFHVGPVCDVEQCPCCGGQVLSCDCKHEGDED